MSRFLTTLTLLFASSLSGFCANGAKYFGYWPNGTGPTEVGTRITENFLQREVLVGKTGVIVYPEVITWYGGLTFAKLSNNAKLTAQLVGRFQPYLTPEGAQKISYKDHVDFRVLGIVPMEIALQNGSGPLKKLGLDFADRQWAHPTEDGVTSEARYWIDDMYMIPVLQVQAYRLSQDPKYLDRVALTMVAYLDKLQQANGLFFHAPDSPYYWGRGNGWFAAGMAEVLSVLPPTHPHYARILEGYKRMMATLLATQSPEGLWRQLIDKQESWLESSGSAMFTYAIVVGVKKGLLEEDSYGPAARKAWLALVALLDEKANLKEVCVGTNKGAKEVGPDLDTQYKFYMGRKRDAGDRHGQAPMLWTASALLQN